MDKTLNCFDKFYIPGTKDELASWLAEYYEESWSHFYNMGKKRLTAIYINTRKKMGR